MNKQYARAKNKPRVGEATECIIINARCTWLSLVSALGIVSYKRRASANKKKKL